MPDARRYFTHELTKEETDRWDELANIAAMRKHYKPLFVGKWATFDDWAWDLGVREIEWMEAAKEQ